MPAKLKVFRTPIGFHDAYVAAPSQKAALAAWGSDVNLFARGSAELVTDEDLTREPLANPGQVIRRLRGSADEHLAALPPDPPRQNKPPTADKPVAPRNRPTKPKPRPLPPRPSREAVDAAEHDLDTLVERQRREDDQLRARERKLKQERDALTRVHERERAAAERRVDTERQRHATALARWSDTRSARS